MKLIFYIMYSPKALKTSSCNLITYNKMPGKQHFNHILRIIITNIELSDLEMFILIPVTTYIQHSSQHNTSLYFATLLF